MDWLKAAPYMEPFVNCLAANRVLHYAHPSLAQQVRPALQCLTCTWAVSVHSKHGSGAWTLSPATPLEHWLVCLCHCSLARDQAINPGRLHTA